jgi:hypothetical protein
LVAHLVAGDVGERRIAVFARNARVIFHVGEPVPMRELARCPLASVRDEGDVAHMLQTG